MANNNNDETAKSDFFSDLIYEAIGIGGGRADELININKLGSTALAGVLGATVGGLIVPFSDEKRKARFSKKSRVAEKGSSTVNSGDVRFEDM